MRRVQIVHWNPRGNLIGERLPVRRRINNFGDLIGPLLVELMTGRPARRAGDPGRRATGTRLLTVGSILHLAREGDSVWGSGVHGARTPGDHRFRSLDVRAVRGPLTRAFLLDRGIEAPEVYGDPALLLPDVLPELRTWSATKTRGVAVVPNFADFARMRVAHGTLCIDPRAGLTGCLRAIAQSEAVVGSSLHGIVVAESLGIPARLLASTHESTFKYEDYYRGTGRDPIAPASSLDQALREMPATVTAVRPDPALKRAFPHDLFSTPERTR